MAKVTPAMRRDYKQKMEEFKLKLHNLLTDYNVHIYVEDPEGYYNNSDTLGLYCKGEFVSDFEQPIKGII